MYGGLLFGSQHRRGCDGCPVEHSRSPGRRGRAAWTGTWTAASTEKCGNESWWRGQPGEAGKHCHVDRSGKVAEISHKVDGGHTHELMEMECQSCPSRRQPWTCKSASSGGGDRRRPHSGRALQQERSHIHHFSCRPVGYRVHTTCTSCHAQSRTTRRQNNVQS